MTILVSSLGGPPNIFQDGQPRNQTAVRHDTERYSYFAPTNEAEATQVPLPDSPIEESGNSFETLIDDMGCVKADEKTDNITDGILSNLPSIFRLLNLYQEQGSGGLVEKVLIDQNCLRRLLNTFLPGSYESVSKIDFKALDKCTIKPLGVYGSKPELVRFLGETNCLSGDSKMLLSSSIGTHNDLTTGLYLALPFDHKLSCKGSNTEIAYIFYWPEDSTWEDNAISSVRRNRITFMRYLTKLTDQIIALISREQAGAMVWTQGLRSANEHGVQSEIFDESRMFSFEVEKSTEQEEDAIAMTGFKVKHDSKIMPTFKVSAKTCLIPGEEKAGIMTAALEPSIGYVKRESKSMYPAALKSMIGSTARPIFLGELTGDQLRILSEHGLREAYSTPFIRYEKQMEEEEKGRNREYEESIKKMKDSMKQDERQLKRFISLSVRDCYSHLYPSLWISGFTPDNESLNWGHLRERYIELENVPQSIRKNLAVGNIDDPEFKDLKLAWHTIQDYLLQDPTPSPALQAEFIAEVLGSPSDGEWTVVTKGKGSKHAPKLSWKGVKKVVFDFFGYKAEPPATLLSDMEFIRALRSLADKFPVTSALTDRITTCLKTYLSTLSERLVKSCLEKVEEEEERRLKDLIDRQRQHRFRTESSATERRLLNDLRVAMASNNPNSLRINSIEKENGYGATKFRVRTEHTVERGPRTVYTIYPLELTERDVRKCRANERHIPEPELSSKQIFKFELREGQVIKFIHLVRDKCLVIIAGPSQFDLYIEDNLRLPRVIAQNHPKRSFKYDRLGDLSQCRFAFDESTRLLALFHNSDTKGPELTMFGFDETFTNVHLRGSPFVLKDWYENEVHVDRICFVTGTEEICLIETSGQARVLSMVTLNFRPASIQISGRILDAFSAPDGSCLLVLVMEEPNTSAGQKLLVFHWASFGATQNGINPIVLPPSTFGRVITSLEGRNRIHIISFFQETMEIVSTVLQIKQKTTEFSFRSNQAAPTTASTETVNNCLVDCHMDVWTRFPVAPAVIRSKLFSLGRESRKLVFASASSMVPMNSYFSRMITKFERTTCKPINAELKLTYVAVFSDPLHVLVQNTQCSRYQLGGFIAELMCLIPLHLAIAKDNRFIPLKDGVCDPEYERSLLGADVPAIIDSLSIGWYESLFQSYMANKPVKVVSSMGEQSVGKSYCLNHFADTSFAGSAMRTTEGVWLSCTPTDDYLLVSLDFEGFHSIERTPQEDALLVLFNTAISNLVLFRNNFAFSRDIAGLFQSFQSSAMVLDPDSSPSLFNSTLAIIIKDVTDSDSKDIVKEFSLKFQRIVQKEQEQNFISRLHRGKVQIIPWPVINSSSFYTLFNHLRRYLDGQPVTHTSGGIFLHNMKTMMAKIKANDWSSLDQNLATHRAQQINKGLNIALSQGSADTDTHMPLKNLDTDEDLPINGPSIVFFVPDASATAVSGDDTEKENALENLINFCLAGSNIGSRHIVGDAAYIRLIQEQLFKFLEQRLEYVRSWVQVNVQRFPAVNQDIRNIYNKVDSMELSMRTAVQLCTETCSSCHYRCIRSYRHLGEHRCGTTHCCPFSCEVLNDHHAPIGCGLPAGHSAQHMCNVKAHSCGNDCHLIDHNGCVQSCVKPMFHEGEHLCSARLHSCGEPCSLEDVKSGYRCPGLCHIPWDEPHVRHRCNNSNSCPMECQLCRRLCHESDHFHALDSNALHLCGQVHSCTSPCAARGICRIETQPSAVEEQFSGRHETFQYTRYTQVEQRLTCAIPIPPGKIYHEGEHSHTTDEKAFHHCNVRCPSCQYVCTLPLGHPQQLHETSHGSMTTTRWTMQGANQDARYELNGRSFGIGDEGAPMLCHLVCSAQGRHVHIEFCREPNHCGGGAELEHISEPMHPDPKRAKDWISHRLKWARSGFQDPYSREQQADFAKCDALCPGFEHEATATAAANPSYCNLPIFHQPHSLHVTPPNGYVSSDGHCFDCSNPARLQQAYHVVFVIDSSGSMDSGDRTPLSNTPVTTLLRGRCNNRYGAVLSALHSFWSTRETGNPNTQPRQDAYSVITFNNAPTTRVANDLSSTIDQLLSRLLRISASGGTNFNAALSHARTLIGAHWNNNRTPALVFLSDGQCTLDRSIVYDLCRACIQLGKPLAFYSVSFGPDHSSAPLKEMARIAQEVYATAPRNTLGNIQGDTCAYYNAVDSIQLAGTFLSISNSLHKPRASLIGQPPARRAL